MTFLQSCSKWTSLFCLGSVVVQAQTVTMSLNSVTPWVSVSGHAGSSDFSGVVAGMLNFSVTAQSGNIPPLANSLSLFCVELQQSIGLGSTGNFYSVIPVEQAAHGVNYGRSANIPLTGIGVNRARTLEVLYAHVFPAGYNPVLLTDVQKSAFQLAVWELSHDDGFNLISGSGNQFWLTSTGSSATQARDWVDWVANNFTTAPGMKLSALHNPQKQDFLLPSALVLSPVPEPSTYALLASVAVFASVVWRQRRRRTL